MLHYPTRKSNKRRLNQRPSQQQWEASLNNGPEFKHTIIGTALALSVTAMLACGGSAPAPQPAPTAPTAPTATQAPAATATTAPVVARVDTPAPPSPTAIPTTSAATTPEPVEEPTEAATTAAHGRTPRGTAYTAASGHTHQHCNSSIRIHTTADSDACATHCNCRSYIHAGADSSAFTPGRHQCQRPRARLYAAERTQRRIRS